MDEETTTSLIDTALASGSASALDPEERRLQELVLAIRDDAPSPDADFALRMNARVAAGFPRRRGSGSGSGSRRLPAFLTTRPQMAALGVAASLLIALVVVVSQGGSQHGSVPAPTPAVSATEQSAPDRSAQSGQSAQSAPAAPAAKAAPPAGGGLASPGAPTSSSDAVVVPTPPEP